MMVKYSKKVYPKHDWSRDGGEIDFFAFESGCHNGPVCKRCGFSYCKHCEEGKSPEYYDKKHPCTIKRWDCPKCGINLVLARYSFCPNCGQQLTWENDYEKPLPEPD